MKHIIMKTNYWIFKPISSESTYYYIRSETEGVKKIVWFIGYENHLGLVSSVGGELSEKLQNTLEKEFQSSL